jgi:hypothetical protein
MGSGLRRGDLVRVLATAECRMTERNEMFGGIEGVVERDLLLKRNSNAAI